MSDQNMDQDVLSKMSWSDLINLRNSFPDNSPAQLLIAPYEHRAFARENVQDHPMSGMFMPVLSAGYQGAKATGLMSGRTPASLAQFIQATLGAMEGYENLLK